MTARIAAFAALFALALADAAAAQDDYDRPGPYLGIAGTLAVPAKLESDLDKRVTATAPDATVETDPSLGFNLRAGYRLHPRFAAELRYEWLSGYQTKIDVPGVGTSTVDDFGGWTLSSDAKLYLPGERAQAFLLLGMGALHVQSDDFDLDGTAFAMRFGTGLDVYVTPSIAFTLDGAYVMSVTDVDGTRPDYLSIGWGLMYRF